MIQKGIVESIISPYEYKVRIPRYDKLSSTPGGVLTKDLASAIVCSAPGTKLAYVEGDVVLIGFENDELNKPIILGTLYRSDSTESEQFVSPIVQQALFKYGSELEELKSNKVYTHVKYSNDKGITFTSLYEYSDVITIRENQTVYRSAENINIDPYSTVVYWSVMDANGVDITSLMSIETTIYSKSNDLKESFVDTLIQIPLKFQGLSDLELSFKIIDTKDYDSYHIVLTTDKNVIGSVSGDYIGLCISSEPIAPISVSSYAWLSFYDSVYSLISKISDSLLLRVERNEKSLYGYTYTSNIKTSDGTGLLDGIAVTSNSIDIHGIDNINVYFNSNKSMFIDNENNNFTTKEIDYSNADTNNVFMNAIISDGHLTLMKRNKR